MSYEDSARQALFERDLERARKSAADKNYVAWKLTMLVLPWVCLLAVAVYWSVWWPTARPDRTGPCSPPFSAREGSRKA